MTLTGAKIRLFYEITKHFTKKVRTADRHPHLIPHMGTVHCELKSNEKRKPR